MTQPTVYLIGAETEALKQLEIALRNQGMHPDRFDSAERFLARNLNDPVGCLVIDQDLPGIKGQALFIATRESGWSTPAIIVSQYNDVAACVDAFRHGISDYFRKPANPVEMLSAIERCIQQDIARRELAHKRAEAKKKLESLTPSELKVMHRLFNGHSMNQISQEFGTSFQAISRHRMGIQKKFDLESDVLLFRYVLEFGLEQELDNSQSDLVAQKQ